VSQAGRLWKEYASQRIELGEGTIVLGTSTLMAPADRPQESPPDPQPVSTPPPIRTRWMEGAPDIPPAGILVPSPPKDLFTHDPLATLDLGGIAQRIRDCRACRLCEGRLNTVPGEGAPDARLVVVGEGPGATEDETGRPFVGRAGELLTEILAAIGLPWSSAGPRVTGSPSPMKSLLVSHTCIASLKSSVRGLS
jgi:hypothetical protein